MDSDEVAALPRRSSVRRVATRQHKDVEDHHESEDGKDSQYDDDNEEMEDHHESEDGRDSQYDDDNEEMEDHHESEDGRDFQYDDDNEEMEDQHESEDGSCSRDLSDRIESDIFVPLPRRAKEQSREITRYM